MRVPLELEHLLKKASQLDKAASGQSVSTHLKAIEARKALEVENYLRACILRLDVRDVFN
jgi:hypothetical protein